MVKFLIRNLKTQEEQEYDLSQASIVFGRVDNCDIALPISSVSRRHAEITHEAEDYFLTDLKSGNGTFLNSQKIRPLEKNLLRSGDLIRIEDYEIRFLLIEDKAESLIEENTDTDILEIKLIKKMLKTLDTEELPSIEVLNGVASGKKISISDSKQELIIGRDNNCDLVIDENVLSRHHAKLQRKWGGIVLVDNNSKNGSFVNNEKIKEKLLRDGDKIMLGTVKLLYRNPKDVNLEVLSQEISRKKREAAMREAELLAQKQAEEERLAKQKEAEEKARQEIEATVNAATAPPDPSQAAAALAASKPGFSILEKVMIAAGAIVGFAAITGLVLLLLK